MGQLKQALGLLDRHAPRGLDNSATLSGSQLVGGPQLHGPCVLGTGYSDF